MCTYAKNQGLTGVRGVIVRERETPPTFAIELSAGLGKSSSVIVLISTERELADNLDKLGKREFPELAANIAVSFIAAKLCMISIVFEMTRLCNRSTKHISSLNGANKAEIIQL